MQASPAEKWTLLGLKPKRQMNWGWIMAESMDEFVEGLRTSVTGWKMDVARFEAQEADELAALVARWIAEAEKLIAAYESQNAARTPRPEARA